MVWWLGRPSHRTTISASISAVGNSVVVRKCLKPHLKNDSFTVVGYDILVRMELTTLQ